MRPKALDLFCGAGGVSMGLFHAGFDVYGRDIKPQPRYPFWFQRGDAMAGGYDGFDFIWASPPCQRYSDLAKRNKNADKWPDMIPAVRERLMQIGVPWVIENVEGAPLRKDLILCGTMFPGLRVLRHRVFECSFPISQPPHGKHPLVHTHDRRKNHFGKTNQNIDFVQVTGGGNCSVDAAREAMGIDWMTKDELNEAIPPAYSEWIGRAAMKYILPRMSWRPTQVFSPELYDTAPRPSAAHPNSPPHSKATQ